MFFVGKKKTKQMSLCGLLFFFKCDLCFCFCLTGVMLIDPESNLVSLISDSKDTWKYQEKLKLLIVKPEHLFSEEDKVILPDTEQQTLLAISYGFAQCARLETLQKGVNFYHNNLMVFMARV